MLCGCGRWARDSHLPVIAKMSPDVRLTHVFEVKSECPNVRSALREKGIPNWRQVKVVPAGRNFPLEARPDPESVDACIVATISEQHYPYIQWALKNGIHTLSDKPLTFRSGATTDETKADKLVKDYDELLALSGTGRTPLFMLATQKRYQWAFNRLAERIASVSSVTGQPVTSIDLSTSDGFWLLPSEYEKMDTYDRGGGKMTHTGYHFLDIAPWLMRHSSISDGNSITHAFVTANLYRPSDSVSVRNNRQIGKFMHLSDPEKTVSLSNKMGEINSFVQVKFCRNKDFVTSVNFTLQHDGLSLRTKEDAGEFYYGKGRTKIDHMMITMGPLFSARFSRIAKMIDPDGFSEVGARKHCELVFMSNDLTGLQRIEKLYPGSVETFEGCGDDELPTTDFLEALLDPSRRSSVLSPVSDHRIGILLLSAACRSAALSHQTSDGCPVPVRIDFSKKDWQTPPSFQP